MESEKAERGDWISSAHFEAVLASAMDAIITIDGDQNIVFFNVAAELMFDMKKSEAIGQPLLNLIPEMSREGHDKHVRLFRATGVTGRRMGALGAVSGRRSNGTTFRIEAGISQANVGGKWLATVILRDITERLANEEARHLLSQEVDHRAKNALAVVHAIVKLTTADSTEEYVEAITGRLDALARAHGLLAKGSWTGGDLRQIADEELTGFQRAGQVSFEGPKVTLSVKSVQPLSLLFHELATNAVKHGALSVDEGTVAVRWEVDHRGALLLRWTEAGGPPVVAPERRGFGSSLIESLGEQLRSRQTIDWLPGGLHFAIELPTMAFKAHPELTEDRSEAPANERRKKPGRQVLVVEDEAIVALVLTAGLQSDGWEIIGPASTIEGAYQLLAEGLRPDVAILDINLDGVPIYPLAQVLQARNIPFVFYSGYSAPILDPRFRHVTLIGKPARVHVINDELSRLVADASLIASRS
jgi:PAS domain S-box-containing protein